MPNQALQQVINAAYSSALDDAQSSTDRDTLRQKNISRVGQLTRTLLEHFMQASPSWAGGLSSAASAGGAVGTSAPAASAPTLSLGYGGAVPAYTAPVYSVGGAGGVATTVGGAGAATVGGSSAAASGTTGATAGSSAASGAGVSAGAVAGPIVAGLAVGASKPGDSLFPIKRGMYNIGEYLGHKQFRGASQGLRDMVFGKNSRRNVLANMLSFNGPGFFNNIFGEPNEQLAEAQARLSKLNTLRNMAAMAQRQRGEGEPDMQIEE